MLVFARAARGVLSLAELFGKGLAFKSIYKHSTDFPQDVSDRDLTVSSLHLPKPDSHAQGAQESNPV